MQVKSTYKFARVSPKKARDVAREVQGLPVSDALDVLTYTPKKAAHLIGKTLKSAIANAENNFDLVADTLVVSSATVTDGPTFKRFKPRARGSASAIIKRTSHINIVLDEAPEDDSEPTYHVSGEGAKKKPAAKKEKKKAEPKAEAAPVEEAPAEEAAPAEVDTNDRGLVYDEAPENVDDLQQIKGVGPGIAEKLNGFGIYTFAQISDWNAGNIAAFDELLSFKGRIERDNWLEQAKNLAAGGAPE